jgi:hypothetical protein
MPAIRVDKPDVALPVAAQPAEGKVEVAPHPQAAVETAPAPTQWHIRSSRDGYWRAGLQHFVGGQHHAHDALSAEQVEELRADPVILIEEVPA